MSTKKILLIGCAGVAAICLLAAVVVIVFVANVVKDPEGMRIAVNAPATATNGAEFAVVISVINERKDKPIQVGDVNISEDYLKGFSVVSTEPAFVSSTKNGILKNRTFTFNQAVAPGSTNEFTFKLLGRKVGKYYGEIDISEGMRMLTMVVETQVE